MVVARRLNAHGYRNSASAGIGSPPAYSALRGRWHAHVQSIVSDIIWTWFIDAIRQRHELNERYYIRVDVFSRWHSFRHLQQSNCVLVIRGSSCLSHWPMTGHFFWPLKTTIQQFFSWFS